ncbi:hypothetical protein SCHPADRAFT_180311 [Schizopora paradoxa]|uniref:Uncharacterized protein n=1 Tax=Schizopora paradoxa TaxID=27342 RepID=A0A0H2RYD2_9AGAM|nr:hypothetical protein SCHPADRAFT_180311 [Schizopora paradoxa]
MTMIQMGCQRMLCLKNDAELTAQCFRPVCSTNQLKWAFDLGTMRQSLSGQMFQVYSSMPSAMRSTQYPANNDRPAVRKPDTRELQSRGNLIGGSKHETHRDRRESGQNSSRKVLRVNLSGLEVWTVWLSSDSLEDEVICTRSCDIHRASRHGCTCKCPVDEALVASQENPEDIPRCFSREARPICVPLAVQNSALPSIRGR